MTPPSPDEPGRETRPGPDTVPPPDPTADGPAALPSGTRKQVRKFRDQMHALGALWVVLGMFALAIGGVALVGSGLFGRPAHEPPVAFLSVFIGMGVLAVALGVLTLLKQTWAVYAGLVLSYASLLIEVLNLSACGTLIMVAAVVQAHRVLGRAARLTAAGVPLTARPE